MCYFLAYIKMPHVSICISNESLENFLGPKGRISAVPPLECRYVKGHVPHSAMFTPLSDLKMYYSSVSLSTNLLHSSGSAAHRMKGPL